MGERRQADGAGNLFSVIVRNRDTRRKATRCQNCHLISDLDVSWRENQGVMRCRRPRKWRPERCQSVGNRRAGGVFFEFPGIYFEFPAPKFMRSASGGAVGSLQPLAGADRRWRWLPAGRPCSAWSILPPRTAWARACSHRRRTIDERGPRCLTVAGLPLCQPRFAGLALSGFTPLNTRARSGCAASGPF